MSRPLSAGHTDARQGIDTSNDELEAENQALEQELMQASGQRFEDVKALHRQLADIAGQNQRLAHMIHDQSETIDQLFMDAEETDDNVTKGNRELQQAVR